MNFSIITFVNVNPTFPDPDRTLTLLYHDNTVSYASEKEGRTTLRSFRWVVSFILVQNWVCICDEPKLTVEKVNDLHTWIWRDVVKRVNILSLLLLWMLYLQKTPGLIQFPNLFIVFELFTNGNSSIHSSIFEGHLNTNGRVNIILLSNRLRPI